MYTLVNDFIFANLDIVIDIDIDNHNYYFQEQLDLIRTIYINLVNQSFRYAI